MEARIISTRMWPALNAAKNLAMTGGKCVGLDRCRMWRTKEPGQQITGWNLPIIFLRLDRAQLHLVLCRFGRNTFLRFSGKRHDRKSAPDFIIFNLFESASNNALASLCLRPALLKWSSHTLSTRKALLTESEAPLKRVPNISKNRLKAIRTEILMNPALRGA